MKMLFVMSMLVSAIAIANPTTENIHFEKISPKTKKKKGCGCKNKIKSHKKGNSRS